MRKKDEDKKGNLVQLKIERNKKYTTMRLDAAEDKNLSWKAKGLHTYLISRPPGWTLWIGDLRERSTDGKTSLNSGLKELKEKGYIKIENKKDEKGRFSTIWTVREKPKI